MDRHPLPRLLELHSPPTTSRHHQRSRGSQQSAISRPIPAGPNRVSAQIRSGPAREGRIGRHPRHPGRGLLTSPASVEGVVPVAVEEVPVHGRGCLTPARCALAMPRDSHPFFLAIRRSRNWCGRTFQPGAGGGRRDAAHNDVVAGQWADVGEQPVVKSAQSAVSSFDRAISLGRFPHPACHSHGTGRSTSARPTAHSCLHLGCCP